jgi:acyl transferase domain-containing protein
MFECDVDAPEQRERVAIIGLACRFPLAQDPEAFWQLLRDGVNAITEVPEDRWDVDALYDPKHRARGKTNSRWGGFVDHVDQFDAHFFGISPREASHMDPQQRLLLETAWEALEYAGVPPTTLSGSHTGVFVGISSSDYICLQVAQKDHLRGLTAFSGTGNAHSIAANRLSYFLDLRGPSLAVDTACSSSLVAVHLACRSLRSEECDLALAGGVSLMFSPETTVAFSQAGMLAPDGLCKTFDARANGYVRGEGCGIVLLKRLTEAKRDGDRILAVIRGSAVNQDGRSNGLTAPNGPAQQAVIRRALEDAGVTANQLTYVEAHGTGTSLGDPIEVGAIAEVLAGSGARRCLLGSVKANIGHLEAAAGIAGLIKVVLALEAREIPPQIHLQKLNPLIDIDDTPLEIPTIRQTWAEKDTPRVAGVSSFGFGGTNAHVVVEEAPVSIVPSAGMERPLHVFALSAKTDNALREAAGRFGVCLASHPASLPDVCFTANVGRSHWPHRLAAVVDSRDQLRDRLASFASAETAPGLVSGLVPRRNRPKLAFAFPGEGAEHRGMGQWLYDTQPTFRSALDHCADIASSYLPSPLTEMLFSDDPTSERLREPAHAQLTLFALQLALANLWQTWGIEPDGSVGYGVGEIVAECVSGALNVEEALQLIAAPAVPAPGPSLAVAHDRLPSGPKEFEAAVRSYVANGFSIFLQMGPSLRRAMTSGEDLPAEGTVCWLPTLDRPEDDWSVTLNSLAELYVRGRDVDWVAFDRDYTRRRVPLPTYPFERERYWVETPAVQEPRRHM